MSQEQQFLSPEQQATLFQKMKDAGLLSKDIGQSQDVPDSQAQSGVGNVDLATLQSLFKHASNPDAVPMQNGDAMHPMDAISQIGQKLMSPSPLATGPKLQPNSNGELQARMKMEGSPAANVLGMLGVKHNVPVTSPNYFAAAKAAGIDKYLPSGLAQMPDGSPFVGPAVFAHALAAHRVSDGQGNQTYGTLDELTSQGIPDDTARKMLASSLAAGKKGVSDKDIGHFQRSQGLDVQGQLADARSTMAAVASMKQKLDVGGFDSIKPALANAGKTLGAIEKAQGIIDQIVANGGTAIQSQRAELATALATITANGQGIATDTKMNEFMPSSAKAKFGNLASYWTNQNQPMDFSGFLPQMQDMVSREKKINQTVFQQGLQLGQGIYGLSNPQGAQAIGAVSAANPLVGSGNTPPPATQAAPSGDAVSAYLSKINAKMTPANIAWARKKLGI